MLSSMYICGSQVISLDEMSRISFAAGGENDDYFFITYIAKDKRENRCKSVSSSPDYGFKQIL